MSKIWLRSASANKFAKLYIPLLATTLGGISSSTAISRSLDGSPAANLSQQAEEILSRLDLSAKVGQMIQGEILNVKEAMEKGKLHPVRDLGLGSVLAGGNSIIADNSPAGWRLELSKLQAEAKASAAGLPLLIGVDAVHGHGIVVGATVFPHNIGLGAANDPQLMREIGSVVAKEVLSTGFNWTFAPAVSVARDARWGRTYESLGESPDLQRTLTEPFIRGLQETPFDNITLSATAKHFIGDGGTLWGTGFKNGTTGELTIDRGDTLGNVQDLIALHGVGYVEAMKANVDTVMISYSSINGMKMHEKNDLINNYLKTPADKGGLGFQGLVISDWNAIDDLETPGVIDPLKRFKLQIVTSVNAGIDMLMVSDKLDITLTEKDSVFRFDRTHQYLMEAVREGLIPMSRIDDAVTRILKIKIKTGIIANAARLSLPPPKVTKEVLGVAAHRDLARRAVRESLVLLKNEGNAFPITKNKYTHICVAGSKADNFGSQVGAWTVGWQGTDGNSTKTADGVTILQGLRAAATAAGIPLTFSANGKFPNGKCRTNTTLHIVVVGEQPYAEFFGDSKNLVLSTDDNLVLHNAKSARGITAVLLISGRPLIVTNQLPGWQALVAAWLPGSQGDGVADVLFGKANFSGRLSQSWPTSMDQLPFTNRDDALFPSGYGLEYAQDVDSDQQSSKGVL